MRKRELIEKDGARVDKLQLEVLLDIRDLMSRKVRRTKIKGEPKNLLHLKERVTDGDGYHKGG